jgi:hypothetical protein
MNRLTRQISLVLISSSLVLHGCHHRVPEEAKQQQEDKPWDEGVPPPGTDQQQGSSPDTSGHVGHIGTHYYPRGGSIFVPVPVGGGGGPMPSRGPTTGPSSSSLSGRSALGGRSAVGGSARGGFGGVAHGIAGS